MDNYNNSNIVAKRKLETSIKYSKLSIVFSSLTLVYIMVMLLVPPVEFFSFAYIVMLIIDKILLYICPLVAVIFAIFGLQQKENHLRKTALIISIISSVIAIVTIVIIVYSLTVGVIGLFDNLIEWVKKTSRNSLCILQNIFR